ncbi:unnamed protein product, partial [marine sediment metagenome]
EAPKTLEERIQRAAELGTTAFGEGAERTPAKNAELMELMEGLEVGEGGSKIMDAWTQAWDKENLKPEAPKAPAAPEGETIEKLKEDLEQKGAGRIAGVDYKILKHDTTGSYYYTRTENGIRETLGGGGANVWGREYAIKRALQDAKPEAPEDVALATTQEIETYKPTEKPTKKPTLGTEEPFPKGKGRPMGGATTTMEPYKSKAAAQREINKYEIHPSKVATVRYVRDIVPSGKVTEGYMPTVFNKGEETEWQVYNDVSVS